MKKMQGRILYNFNSKNFEFYFLLDGISKNDGITVKSETERKNQTDTITITIIPENNIIIQNLYLSSEIDLNNTDKIFLNGYQSWTDSREFRIDETIPGLSRILKPLYNKFHLPKFGDYHFHTYKKKKGVFHSFTYTYIRNESGHFTLLGSLSEKKGFTKFQYDILNKILTIHKDCKGLCINREYKAFQLLITEGSENDVFKEYFMALNIKKPTVKTSSGWTSWYNHFTKITEEIILKNLNAYIQRNIPIDIFQIDDGYQESVGDWLIISQKFPKGMKYLSDIIKKSGYKSGLWLAPFICEQKSDLFKNHKEWLLKDRLGKPVLAGMNDKWSGDFYALDFYNLEFRDYLKKVLQTVINNWGYDLVKLDFLYAVCLLPREDKTRGQIMTEAMEFLKDICGNRLTLGCGVPLGPAFGMVDYCRIGNDVSLDWEYNDATIIHYRERVSTINTLICSINRRQLNGNVFLNDPDAIIIRHTNNSMNEEQRHTLFLINIIFGGIIFTSDDIDDYNNKEMDLYLSQFPLKEKNFISVIQDDSVYRWKNKESLLQIISGVNPYQNIYKMSFEIENKKYYAIVNLGRNKINIQLPEGIYYNGAEDKFYLHTEILNLKPYESKCLSVITGNDYEIAGSTGHIFPGCDVEVFKINKDNVEIKTVANPKRKSIVYVKIPDNLEGLSVNQTFTKAFRFQHLNMIKLTL